MHRRRLQPLLVLLVASLVALPPAVAEPLLPSFPQGVASGDPTHESVVLWTRTDRPAELILEVFRGETPVHQARLATRAEDDHTVQHRVDGLDPATVYAYRFHSAAGGVSAEGVFATAAAPEAESLPSFVFGGDVGGQGFCRHADTGYVVYRSMLERDPDFFVANGDMIYADSICPAVGPELDGEPWPNLPGDFPSVADLDWRTPAVRQAIDAHWRYNRAEPHARAFYARVPYYAQWDDHEVINDFGVPWESWPHRPEKPGFPALVDAGRDAFFAWNPLPVLRHPQGDPHGDRRVYRSVRRGRHLEIFFLDGRSYRNPNLQPDGPEKTLLGAAQKEWLIESVTASDATWKVIASDVPISMVTGWPEIYGRDAFADGLANGEVGPENNPGDKTNAPKTTEDAQEDAHQDGEEFDASAGVEPSETGAEHELLEILRAFDAAGVENLLVLATDVHFASQIRFATDLDGDGDPLRFHEVICGPMNAVAVEPKEPDPTLSPEVLWAKGEIFNWAHLELVEGEGDGPEIEIEILDVHGEVLPGSRLVLRPISPETAR